MLRRKISPILRLYESNCFLRTQSIFFGQSLHILIPVRHSCLFYIPIMAYKRQPTKGPSAMERSVPKNHKFDHIQSSLNTGCNVNKVKTVTAREYARRRLVVPHSLSSPRSLSSLTFSSISDNYTIIYVYFTVETRFSTVLPRSSSPSCTRHTRRKSMRICTTTTSSPVRAGPES
jgi:hypothetical protein